MTEAASVLDVLERCFSGAVPCVLATSSAAGVPNVTFLSKAHRVDHERIALSNQFMSKTTRNLASNPLASLLLLDPVTGREYRLALVYERTERRGHVFERLRTDIDAVAAHTGMQDVFRLRAATIFRVRDVTDVTRGPREQCDDDLPAAGDGAVSAAARLAAVAELTARIGRCDDLDVLVDTALDGLVELLGYRHLHLLLLDETGRLLYTMASRGFDADSVGAEVVVGAGPIGAVAARCQPVRLGNLRQMAKYSEAIRRGFEEEGGIRPGQEVRMPGLSGVDSRLVVPAMALGQLVGIIVAESSRPAAFDPLDEQALGAVAGTVANAIELLRTLEADDVASRSTAADAAATAGQTVVETRPVDVRHFAVDGSTFVDGDYLIKGVAGRILRSLVAQHVRDGRVDFTNRELRLDPTLDLPGFKDNLESRLILLKRRLDERGAPVRIEKTGRGRFRLVVAGPVRLSEE